jgi:hypothetical protein
LIELASEHGDVETLRLLAEFGYGVVRFGVESLKADS